MKCTLSFSDDSISFVDGVVSEKDGISIKKFCKIDLPKNLIANGIINDSTQLSEILKEFLKENKIEKIQPGIVIESSKILFKEITLPNSKPKELKEMVHNEVLSSMGDMGEFLVDYIVKNETENNMVNILAFVISTKIIKDYVEFLDEAGIAPESIDISSNCICKLVCSTDSLDTICVLSINRETIGMNLIENGNSVLSRNLRLNFNTFKASGNLDIAVEELADNYNRISQFQRSRSKNEGIKKIYLTGVFDDLDNVCSILKNYVTPDCEVFSGNGRIKSSGNFSINEYIAAAGALIRRG